MTASTTRRARALAGLAATAMLSGVAVIGAAPAQAAEAGPAWSGFVASGWAAPVKIEMFEPMLPIPADPQLELEMGYSVVKTDSGSSKSRSSWLWPGDVIGDGLKTIVEQMGLPPQLGANGYPVQVNAEWPSDVTSEKDEPVPGMVMRTSAGEKTSTAQVGFSPDSDIADLPNGTEKPATSGSGGLLGLPGLPKLPVLGQVLDLTSLPIISELAKLGQGKSPDMSMAGIPKQLAGIIDFSGYSSKTTTSVTNTEVKTVAQAALGDVRILGGLIRLEGVTAQQESVSNGKTASSKGASTVGGIVVLGQRFAFTDQGFVVAGMPVGGVPPELGKALKMLGVTITMPQVTKTDEGLKAAGLAEGIKVEIDASLLAKALKILPLGQLVDLIPSELGQLKSVAGLLTGLSPRTVITLGNAGTATETVTALVPETPSTPTAEQPSTDPTTPAAPSDSGTDAPTVAGDSTTSSGSGGTDTALPDTTAPGAPADEITDGATAAPETTDTIAAMGAGLPALNSIPGFLTLLALGLAGAGGVYLRKAGILALGTGASCSHGLDSGLPDLRKA